MNKTQQLYTELAYQLRRRNDLRSVQEITRIALKEWIARNCGQTTGRGYQWKGLFLPNGTSLRIRHAGLSYFAGIEGDLMIYEGKATSPNAWAAEICDGVRNAWRDIWIRRHYTDLWTRAAAWRTTAAQHPGIERRRRKRRNTD